MKPASIEDRFWAKTERRGAFDCWPWHGAKNRFGRGSMSAEGRGRMAPHVSWFLANQSWPPAGLSVCHSCDNPNCVNPRHLWLGTQQDNLRDMRSKGRAKWKAASRGPRKFRGLAAAARWRTKTQMALKGFDWRAAKQAVENGASPADLSAQFKISMAASRHIGKHLCPTT